MGVVSRIGIRMHTAVETREGAMATFNNSGGKGSVVVLVVVVVRERVPVLDLKMSVVLVLMVRPLRTGRSPRGGIGGGGGIGRRMVSHGGMTFPMVWVDARFPRDERRTGNPI
jgi:hypothetical protein